MAAFLDETHETKTETEEKKAEVVIYALLPNKTSSRSNNRKLGSSLCNSWEPSWFSLSKIASQFSGFTSIGSILSFREKIVKLH